ncbi:MAG TPA: glycosyltransferase [Actinocrinis sp.]|nr:glycosyltransferase [Actinocrinis sp.]
MGSVVGGGAAADDATPGGASNSGGTKKGTTNSTNSATNSAANGATNDTAKAKAEAVLVLLNLPVPDDQRAWSQAEALRDDGVAVTVVCPAIHDIAPGTKRIDGIDVVYYASFEGNGKLATVLEGVWTATSAARAARRALAPMRGAPRTLQVGNPPDLLFGLLRWARRRGCTTVYDQRDAAPELAASRAGFDRLGRLFLACERRMVAAADVVLVPSGEQAARLRRIYDRDSVMVRTAAVTAPVAAPADAANDASADAAATDAIAADAATAPQDAKKDDAETVLGYLGVIGEQDGVGDLIDAVDLLRGRGVTGFRVEIAGDGPALPEARRRAEQLGLDGLVHFRGWLGRGEVDAFLGELDAMLVPDPDVAFNHYCAMNKVTHAMARAVPVVLRPLRENTALVDGHGILARDMSLPAFADAIAELLALPAAERASTGARLREVFDRELDWSQSGRRYVDAASPLRARRS